MVLRLSLKTKHEKASDTLKHQPRGLQYLTHAHSHITLAVAAMDSCFVLVRTHQHGIAPGQVSLTITDPAFTAKACATSTPLSASSHTTHVVAVGWGQHGRPPTACVWGERLGL